MIAQAPFTGYTVQHDEQNKAFHWMNSSTVFRALPEAMTREVLGRLERKERIVLILLDGKRTLQNVSWLTHRSETEMAHILVRLLHRGFITLEG